LRLRLLIADPQARLMDASEGTFAATVDELVAFSEHDAELAEGIRWIDEQARKRGVSFYDMVFEVLYRHDVDSRAQRWARSRN